MALITAPPDATRRHALLIGTLVYQPGWGAISEGVRGELARAKRLFVEELGYGKENVVELLNPSTQTLLKEVARWRSCTVTTPDDWLLVYYTGHGVERAGMLHLITSDTESDLPETALTAQQVVIALLGSQQPSHVLLILDTCQSAAAQLDVTSTAARLRDAEGGAARGADFHVITSARSIDYALVGHFIEALSTTLAEGSAASRDDEHVQFGPALERVNAFLGKLGDQRAGYAGTGERGSRFLPNPTWVPRLQKNMDEEVRSHVLNRIQSIALRSHWNPRARGVATERDAGWFFTGRSRALQEIVRWLGTPDGRSVVVRGRPGSGKSAVLARIVTLADAQQRPRAEAAGVLAGVPGTEIPPPGAFAAAIHARAKEPSQLALELGAALNLPLAASSGDAEAATIQALAVDSQPITIAIDALDEAQRPSDCAAFVRRLVNKAPHVRFLIGVRTSNSEHEELVAALGNRMTQLDLDAPEWYGSDDVTRYVGNYLLNARGSPYASAAPEIRARLAQAIGKRAGTSFLVASVTAHALVERREVVDPDLLQQQLPATVGEALTLDLARFPGSAGEQIRNVLSALAFTEGKGLPRQEWLAIARALGGDVSEVDLDRWGREAGFYIVRDQEFGAPVHRLYHEEFARELHTEASQVHHAPIAPALLELVPRDPTGGAPTWDGASSYLLTYFANHLGWESVDEWLSLQVSRNWIDAKRRRFVSLEPILLGLDAAANVWRTADPPAVANVVRVCAIYSRFSMVAPPLVIDILAALGQQGRADLMARNIEFPLDRCQAFALLAIRRVPEGHAVNLWGYLESAERAARVVKGHFESMALYWVTRAARAAGIAEFAQRAVSSIHATLDSIPPTGHAGADPALLESRDASQVGFFLWANDRWEEDKAFALPHWLFWAAMCLHEAGDAAGLRRIRAALAGTKPLPTNLVLQTAAVSGDLAYLRSVSPGGIAKPRNLALALIEAGLLDEFDALRKSGALDGFDFADAAKRYAWALARRGDWNAALDVASNIALDLEEQARAYYRISQVASAVGNRQALEDVATRAADLLARLRDGDPDAVPRWRLESWTASVMLAAGRQEEARKLAESVCEAGIAPSLEKSLAMAVPRTAYAKGHVRFGPTVDVDQGLIKRIVDLALAGQMEKARSELVKSDSTPRTWALGMAALAGVEPDSLAAYNLWLDALVASRSAGRQTVMDVIGKIDSLKAIRPAQTPAELRDIVAAVDSEFAIP